MNRHQRRRLIIVESRVELIQQIHPIAPLTQQLPDFLRDGKVNFYFG